MASPSGISEMGRNRHSENSFSGESFNTLIPVMDSVQE